jgi:hypothetical protein
MESQSQKEPEYEIAEAQDALKKYEGKEEEVKKFFFFFFF